MKESKELIPIRISLLVSLAVVVIAWEFREAVLKWVLVGSLVVVILFMLYFCVAQFVPRLRESKWLSVISNAVIIYVGFLLISLSFDKSLLTEIKWDASMAGLGIAVAVFGFGLFMQRRNQQTKEASGELGVDVSGLSEKIVALNEKFNKLENVIDALLEKYQGLAKRLTQLDKEQ